MDAGLALAAGIVAAGIVAIRSRRPGPHPVFTQGFEAPGAPWSLVAAAWLAGGVFLAGLLSAFRFVHDDYPTLMGACWHARPVDDLRWLGVQLPFALGCLADGATWVFASLNGIAILSGVAVLFAVLRVAGIGARVAALAAGLSLLNPGYVMLARWGVGFQWLAAVPASLAPLWALGLAHRCDETGERRASRGWLLVAVGLAALAVRTKAPPMFVVPLSGWLWARFVLGMRGRGPWAWLVLAVVAQASQVALCRAPLAAALEFEKASGPLQVGANIERLLVVAWRALLPMMACLGLLLAYALSVASSRIRAHRDDRGREPSAGAALQEGAREVAVATMRRATGPGVRRRLVGALVLACVAAAPALAKTGEFNDYYLTTSFPWLATMIALLSCIVAPPHRSRVLVTAIAAWLLLPVQGLQRVHAEGPGASVDTAAYNQVEAWSREVANAIKASPEPPCAVVVSVACADPEVALRSAELLRKLYVFSEQGAAVRWFAGRDDVSVRMGEEGSVPRCRPLLRVSWCEGAPLATHLVRDDRASGG
jgi:hypothetical protein